MADDNRIKLGLDLGNSVYALAELSSNLKQVKAAGQGVADTYEVLAGAGANYAAVEQQVNASVEAAVRNTQAQKAMAAVLADVHASSQKAGDGISKLGPAALQASYAFQDFTSVLGTQGFGRAIGSVQNNIPGLLTSLGAGAGLAGAVSVVAVGVGILIDNWDNLTKSFEDSLPKIPQIRGDLEGLSGALAGINSQIADLQEKSLTDALSDVERRRLAELQELRTTAQNLANDQKLIEAIKREAKPEDAAFIEAVKKSIAKSGGGEAVAGALRQNEGITIAEAQAIVAGAIRGNRSDVDRLRRGAGIRNPDDVGFDAAMGVSPEARARRAGDLTRAQEAERDERRRAAENRQARRARQDEEIAQAGRSTPEEERLSAAISYLENNLNRLAPGLKLTSDEIVKAGESLVRLRDVDGVDARTAPGLAIRPFVEARRGVQNNAQLDAIGSQINAGTGGAWNQDQVAEAAKRTQDLVKQGFDLQWSIGAVVGRMQAENQELAGQVAALNGFVNQLQQGQQVTRGRLRRNRR